MNEMQVFDSVDEYYAAVDDPQARRFSPEVDFGVHWIAAEERTWPRWRISFVRNAGEVYAVNLVRGEVLLIVSGMAEDEVERRLEGWANETRTVDWAIARLR